MADIVIRLRQLLTLEFAQGGFRRDGIPMTIVLADPIVTASLHGWEPRQVETLCGGGAQVPALIQGWSAVRPLGLLSQADNQYEIVSNPELFELLCALDYPEPLTVYAIEFVGEGGDRRAHQARQLRFLDLLSSARGSPAEQAAECVRAGLVPAGLLAARAPRPVTAALFGVTRQGVGKALRQGRRDGGSLPRARRAPATVRPQPRGRRNANVDDGTASATVVPVGPALAWTPPQPQSATPSPRRTARRRRPSENPATQVNLPLFPSLASSGEPS
jgi:hypothetical protein